MQNGLPPATQSQVTLIADNPETLDGLQAYLAGVGVASRTTRVLRDAALILPGSSALVLFPDDFALKDVERRLAFLRASRPELLIVLVTSSPGRFRSALDRDDRCLSPVVLPKPAFGWVILDAIRAHGRSKDPSW